MVKFYVYLAVVVCGASVLSVEILGTRVIAPFYGASLYLWSALISVTLAALSVGYAIGGRWADRGPKLGQFALVIGLAGLWIACIPWLRVPLLTISEGAGLRAAVLITATVLFFPPLTLLGMVSPYAIRLLASSLNVVGRTAGNLYSVSTVASVVAAVITGFFLIPVVGVTRLLLLIGLALVATAILGYLIQRRPRTAVVGILLFAAAGRFLVGAVPAPVSNPENGVVAIRQSPYGELRVVDFEGVRYMLIDGGTHTGVDTTTWESAFEYVNVLDLARWFFERRGEMLLVGLGGGSVVKSYVQHGWRVDAVEIDPVVTEVAREYFGLREEEAEVFHMDGRRYLMSCDKVYDIIVMDAFGSSSIPFHLVTEEAFALIRSRLAPDGVLAMNVQSIGWDDPVVSAIAATAGRQFPHVLVLPIAEPPDQLGNLVLLSSARPLNLDEEPPVPQYRFSPEYHRAHAWDNRFEVDTAGATILTDDLNPIDVWTERINLASRQSLHAFFAERGVGW